MGTSAEDLGAAPIQGPVTWDDEADLVVVGSGAGGMSAAATAASLGDSVIVLEKGERLGGTTAKAAAAYWIPNNRYMRQNGIDDPKDAALRYMARLARPQRYNATHATLGLPGWEYDLLEAFYDHAAPAVEYLESIGAFRGVSQYYLPDYFAHVPENAAPTGRVWGPADDAGELGDGSHMIARFAGYLRGQGAALRTAHRVRRLVVHDGRVAGVEATTPAGSVLIGARKAVVFATGGFTHNAELREAFLPPTVFPGCAAVTNEGDFVAIASAVGAQLRNMGQAWLTPIALERAVADPATLIGSFNINGDSMLMVNKYGRRVVNEKTVYNELSRAFGEWDFRRAEYPNLALLMIYDARCATHFASDMYGNPIPDRGANAHVITAATLPELTAAIAGRLGQLTAWTGGLALEPAFAENLQAAVARFNHLARTGADADFHRGETPVEQAFYAQRAPDNEFGNATMYPLAEQGPYHAVIMVAGTLDTKGGPKTTPQAQVIGADGAPIPGLYGVGNCVASASAQAYFAAGATIGPILTFGHLAARAAHEELVTVS